jgi:hypothetical protein
MWRANEKVDDKDNGTSQMSRQKTVQRAKENFSLWPSMKTERVARSTGTAVVDYVLHVLDESSIESQNKPESNILWNILSLLALSSSRLFLALKVDKLPSSGYLGSSRRRRRLEIYVTSFGADFGSLWLLFAFIRPP